MADLTLTTAGRISVVGIPEKQLPAVAGEDITGGTLCRFNTDGLAVNADGSAAGTADVIGMAYKSVKAGMPVTLLRRAVIDGFVLDALAFGAYLYLSDTDDTGAIGDAAGTVSVKVGRVIPAYGSSPIGGTAPDKLLLLEINQ